MMPPTSDYDRAVEALRDTLKLAGHVLYAEASALGRDRSADTVEHAVRAITAAIVPIDARIRVISAIQSPEEEMGS